MALESDEHFAKAFATEETKKGFRSVFDSLNNGFLPFDPSFLDPSAHVFSKVRQAVIVVVNDIALKGQALGNGRDQVSRGPGRAGGVVNGYHSTKNDAAMVVHELDGRLQVSATYVVEIDVDTLGTEPTEIFGEVF